jgi:DNA-binding transcriptional ArsR family regulator
MGSNWLINASIDYQPTCCISFRMAEPIPITGAADAAAEQLDRVFFALSDPVRRAILERLDQGPLVVSEIAAPFAISLQAVSRHIQVLVRAGLVSQARTGRISRCSLDAEPLSDAALWLNRYAKYWQGQFERLAQHLVDIEKERS